MCDFIIILFIEERVVFYLQIGNAYADAVSNIIGEVDYYWSHALFSDETYAMIHKNCNFSSDALSKKCNTALDKLVKKKKMGKSIPTTSMHGFAMILIAQLGPIMWSYLL